MDAGTARGPGEAGSLRAGGRGERAGEAEGEGVVQRRAALEVLAVQL
jgi:hypothetical protein